MLITEASIRVLVIGLGGGSLPLFIHDYFLQCIIDVVEIDPVMLEVAARWFDFLPEDRLKVHIADGLAYVASFGAEGNNFSSPAMLKSGLSKEFLLDCCKD